MFLLEIKIFNETVFSNYKGTNSQHEGTNSQHEGTNSQT